MLPVGHFHEEPSCFCLLKFNSDSVGRHASEQQFSSRTSPEILPPTEGPRSARFAGCVNGNVCRTRISDSQVDDLAIERGSHCALSDTAVAVSISWPRASSVISRASNHLRRRFLVSKMH